MSMCVLLLCFTLPFLLFFFLRDNRINLPYQLSLVRECICVRFRGIVTHVFFNFMSLLIRIASNDELINREKKKKKQLHFTVCVQLFVVSQVIYSAIHIDIVV